MRRRLAGALAALGPLASCSSYPSEPFRPGVRAEPLAAAAAEGPDAAASSFPSYQLMPGDSIDVLYNLEYRLTGSDYVLDLLDQVHITVIAHEEVNGTYQIRPDGKITLPHKGSVQVAGLTVDQLVEKLQALYSDLFRDPVVFVNLTQFGARIEELKRMISSERRGQIFEATLRPDGYITLPIVGDLFAAGLTATELNQAVSKAYAERYSGIQVSTIVRETPSNVVYVLGEVRQPGQFPFSRPLSVTQALALAGVDTNTAGLGTVVVVNMHSRTPTGRVLDVAGLFSGDGGEDALLGRDDVVFVPKSAIAEADLFVDQYITRLLLFRGSSFNYTVGQRIDE
jgi:polysaccharide export outer membrane protein